MGQSYKIFIRDKPVIITDSPQNTEGNFIEIDKHFPHKPVKFIEDEAYWQKAEGFYMLSPKPASSMQLLKQNLKLIYAAGGVVRNEKNELLMINRRGFWDLPKGKVDEDESLVQAALREVEEETGLTNLRLGKLKAVIYHVYFQKEWILKETHWYEMQHSGSGALIPQAEEDIIEAKWVSESEIPDKAAQTYASLREILS